MEARRAHNPKVVGSSPTPATNDSKTPCFEANFFDRGLTFYRFANGNCLVSVKIYSRHWSIFL